jgi:hypothetical protein
MNKKIKIPLFILAILIGGLMFVYAGIDDSPGGQLIGLIVIIVGIIGLIKSIRKT